MVDTGNSYEGLCEYVGGKYDKILNENVDSTLFDETFIVFEVDAIKENKQLFPIVDVYKRQTLRLLLQ